MEKNSEGCANFAFLLSAAGASCLVILNTAIKLINSPDKLSSGEIASAACGVIVLGMIFVILHPPIAPNT